ncbi:MAG: 3-phosphoshikimate 1-carboxyvinyltransferase [Fusobacteriaceae bacterium]
MKTSSKHYLVKNKKNFILELSLPGSKSISNRALLLAALSGKRVLLKNFLSSDDTGYMISALRKLGNKITFFTENPELIIEGNSEKIFSGEIYTGNAGTVMRFISSYIATGSGEVILTGDKRMNERPIKDLIDSLEGLGLEVKYLMENGYPPIKIVSRGIKNKEISISCDKSSQYLSSLLLSAPYFSEDLDIKVENKIVSRPYIDMTLKMMKDFGGEISENKNTNTFQIKKSTYNIDSYLIEGDMSSASYFLAMALITNSIITIKNYFKDSIQGDKKFLEIFVKMGGEILSQSETSITIEGCKKYNGIDIDLNDSPDIAQTLAIVALFAKTPTTIRNVANLRIKETDRIAALNKEITKLGGIFIEFEDSFKIIPNKTYNAAKINTYEDHRMAMSFALAGLIIPNIEIQNISCVSKTFPNYFDIFNHISL